MFDRSWSTVSAIAAIGVLPLAIAQSGSPLSTTSIALTAKPVRIGVQVATVVRPLDLDALTSADFGDSDHR